MLQFFAHRVPTSSCAAFAVQLKMSDSSIVGGSASDAPAAVAVRRRKRPLVVNGPLRVYAVVACAGGLCGTFNGDVPSNWSKSSCTPLLVGLLVASAWALVRPGEDEDDECTSILRAAAQASSKAADTFGYIEYPIRAAAMFLRPLGFMAGSMRDILQAIGNEGMVVSPQGGNQVATQCTVADCMRRWTTMGAEIGTVLRIAPAAAYRMVVGRWRCVHSVVLTRKVNHARLLSRNEPSWRHLGRFLVASEARAPTQTLVVQRPQERTPRWSNALYIPELVLEWVEATMHVKRVEDIHKAAGSFAKIFARSAALPVGRLTANLKRVPAELLRRARVRVDCVSMALWREMWSSMCSKVADDGLPDLYLFTDASPQWRGLEMFASSVDVLHKGALTRRMLPMVFRWTKRSWMPKVRSSP